MTELKQVILVRKDLKMPKGKMAAQVAHAAVEAALKADRKLMQDWLHDGGKKVVLGVENDKDLFRYKQHAEDAGLKTALIKDAGHTVLAPGTITCLGIGPDDEEKIQRVTGDLKMIS